MTLIDLCVSLLPHQPQRPWSLTTVGVRLCQAHTAAGAADVAAAAVLT